MNRENNAPFADRVPRENGKLAFRGNAHGEGRRPMNRDNNAPFADRAPREDGKPAFRGSAHGEGKPAFRRDSENRPPRKPQGLRSQRAAVRLAGICCQPSLPAVGKHPQKAPTQTAEFVSPTRTATCTDTAALHPRLRTAR